MAGGCVMRALSLTQPWASAIALGLKRFETRSWRTDYRGALAIHAARRWPREARAFAQSEFALGRLPERLPRGAIVAVGRLVSCMPTWHAAPQVTAIERLYGDYGAGRFAWRLEDVVALAEPIGCAGKLGLWIPSPEILAAIADGVRAASPAPQPPPTRGGGEVEAGAG